MGIDITKTVHSRLHEVDMGNLAFAKIYSDHMFVADYEKGKWGDCRIIPFVDITLSPANATLHYAQSIFEGLKAYRIENGDVQIFRAEQNAKRMIRSAERMCMPPVPKELFLEAIYELVRLDQNWVPEGDTSSLYIRPLQFAMDSFIGVRPAEKYTFMVITTPVSAYYPQPVKVKIETEYTRASTGGVGFVKTAGNYAASLYPTALAYDQGYDQLIWTDDISHDYIEEAGTMNIMFVIDGKLLTPKTSDTILSGITRASALELARDWGLDVEERRISIREIIASLKQGRLQEAFGIGTAATVSQISVINHEGIDYQLPAIEKRKIAQRISAELLDIKFGRAEDRFGWMHKV